MFSDIPRERLLIYALVASLLPIVLVSTQLFLGLGRLDQMRQQLDVLIDEGLLTLHREAPNSALRERYTGTDRFYLVKELESLPLMQREVDMLRRTLENQGLASQSKVEQRLNFLTNDNKIVFNELGRQSYPRFQEITETLQKPIEVDVSDLQKILALIEGQTIAGHNAPSSRPQIIITDFRLSKKSGIGDNTSYTLNLKLIKREFS